MSIAAYKDALRRTDAPRDIERRVLLESAARLGRGQAAFDAASTPSERLRLLAEGLRPDLAANQGIWAALRHDLSGSGNGLAPDLRAAMVSLGLWVDAATTDLLRGHGRVAPLVELNRTVAQGLGRAPAAEAIACP